MANESILDVIKNRYKIPSIETPEKARLSNNKFSLKNEKFVLHSISKMLKMVSSKRSKLHQK